MPLEKLLYACVRLIPHVNGNVYMSCPDQVLTRVTILDTSEGLEVWALHRTLMCMLASTHSIWSTNPELC